MDQLLSPGRVFWLLVCVVVMVSVFILSTKTAPSTIDHATVHTRSATDVQDKRSQKIHTKPPNIHTLAQNSTCSSGTETHTRRRHGSRIPNKRQLILKQEGERWYV